jgi:hypothetical protein
MSTSENRFIRWFGTIATALIIASIIGIIGMYYTSGNGNSNRSKWKRD